jgi:hypothetical protein
MCYHTWQVSYVLSIIALKSALYIDLRWKHDNTFLPFLLMSLFHNLGTIYLRTSYSFAFSVMMESSVAVMFSYASHRLHLAVEHLKCS